MCFKGVSRVYQGCFKEVSRKFQGSFKVISRVFQGNFKEVLREFQKSFHGVSIFSDKPFEGLSKSFKGLKGISNKLIKFHKCFETFSRKFKAYQKSFKKGFFCCCYCRSFPRRRRAC